MFRNTKTTPLPHVLHDSYRDILTRQQQLHSVHEMHQPYVTRHGEYTGSTYHRWKSLKGLPDDGRAVVLGSSFAAAATPNFLLFGATGSVSPCTTYTRLIYEAKHEWKTMLLRLRKDHIGTYLNDTYTRTVREWKGKLQITM